MRCSLEGLAPWERTHHHRAGDKIFEGITNWIAKGCVQLLGFVWSVMDRTASAHRNAEWFSGTANSPYQVAARIGGLVLLGLFFVSIAHGVAIGGVGGVMRRAFADLPMTVFVMLTLCRPPVLASSVHSALTRKFTLSLQQPSAVRITVRRPPGRRDLQSGQRQLRAEGSRDQIA